MDNAKVLGALARASGALAACQSLCECMDVAVHSAAAIAGSGRAVVLLAGSDGTLRARAAAGLEAEALAAICVAPGQPPASAIGPSILRDGECLIAVPFAGFPEVAGMLAAAQPGQVPCEERHLALRVLAASLGAALGAAGTTARLSAILEAAPDGFVFISPSGEYEYATPKAASIFGEGARRYVGRPVVACWPSLRETLDVRDEAGRPLELEQLAVHRVLKGGSRLATAVERLRDPRSGEERTMGIAASALPGADGGSGGAVIALRDLTPAVRQQRSLELAHQRARAEAARLAAMLEAIPDPVVILDRHGNVTYLNSACARLAGDNPVRVLELEPRQAMQELLDHWRARDVSGQPITADRTWAVRALRGERVTQFEVLTHPETGAEMAMEVSAAPIAGPRGKVEGAVAVVRDMTELYAVQRALARRNAELQRVHERLVRAARHTALGEIATSLAHELRNYLFTIGLDAVQLARSFEARGEPVPPALSTIRAASRDCTAIVSRLQEFVRVDPDGTTEAVDLHAAVEQALALTEPRWRAQAERDGAEIHLELRLAPVPPVRARGASLREVLVNLILNAADAMPHGGKLEVSVEPSPGGAMVTVADTGEGMSPEVASRAFEPFFTTKPNGSGIGLANARALVREFGGDIGLETAPGKGATFRVTLLAAPMEAKLEAAVPPLCVHPFLAGLSILVVDDFAPGRDALAGMLAECGATVLAVADGKAAMQALGCRRFDCVLIDISMPGTSAWEVVRATRAQLPKARVGVVSGWSLSPAEVRTRGVDFALVKGGDAAALLRELAELLAPPRDGAAI